ncbi:MAG: ROK family protein [Bacteroidota bacterium]
MEENHYAIGVDLGGTNIKSVLIDAKGNILKNLQEAIVDAEESKGKQWKDAIKTMIYTLRKEIDESQVPVGLAAPGVPDQKGQAIAYMSGRLYGLVGFSWAEFINESYLPVINDALAALVAESKIGAGKGANDLIIITLGTGVGGGIMIDGKIHQGYGQRAGHLGHITIDFHGTPGIFGMPGTLEDAIGNSTIKARSWERYSTTKALVEAYLQGNAFATHVWLDSVRKLSLGIISMCNAISPEKVIVGGGISKAGDALFKPLAEFMEVYEWRLGDLKVPIVSAECDAFAGAIGAAFYALENKK